MDLGMAWLGVIGLLIILPGKYIGLIGIKDFTVVRLKN
jgi:hypothetical protein